MHSSALGAADLMALRSFSSAARFSLLNGARYSSMVCGLAGFANTGLSSLRDQRLVLNRRVPLKRLFGGVGTKKPSKACHSGGDIPRAHFQLPSGCFLRTTSTFARMRFSSGALVGQILGTIMIDALKSLRSKLYSFGSGEEQLIAVGIVDLDHVITPPRFLARNRALDDLTAKLRYAILGQR